LHDYWKMASGPKWVLYTLKGALPHFTSVPGVDIFDSTSLPPSGDQYQNARIPKCYCSVVGGWWNEEPLLLLFRSSRFLLSVCRLSSRLLGAHVTRAVNTLTHSHTHHTRVHVHTQSEKCTHMRSPSCSRASRWCTCTASHYQ
jgi:hypothetical protein